MSNGIFLLGAQIEGPLVTRDIWLVPNRVYHFPLRWDECEISPGIYTLPSYAYDNIVRMNKVLGQGNYQLVIGVKCCPKFYAVNPGYRNSPVKPENALEFANFIQVVDRTFSPYGIEIWNEPEFSFAEITSNQPYFGGYGTDGALYGQTVAQIYAYLKDKSVAAKIIGGASFGFVDIPRSLNFLRDAVGAGMQADYWSWHGYTWYYQLVDNLKEFYNFLWFSDATYEIYQCPQILSEVSVVRDTRLPELPEHRATQVKLLEFLMRYYQNTCLESIWWYTLANNGWRHSDMVQNSVEQPVYSVWKSV